MGSCAKSKWLYVEFFVDVIFNWDFDINKRRRGKSPQKEVGYESGVKLSEHDDNLRRFNVHESNVLKNGFVYEQ